jgi:DNA mismatch repair protein MutS
MDAALGPPEKMVDRQAELTPMMAQYFELCDQYDDALVLFQVGDFYEAFCEAAETVARQCEVALTKREDSTGQYAMAGIPIDNAESYVERLLESGYRVAVADQVQDPEETTGVVDRAVTRILTPGTLTEDELLDSDRHNFVAAVTAGDSFAVAVLDISTGDFYATSARSQSTIADELGRFDPAEAIVGPNATAEMLPDGCIESPYTTESFDVEVAREHLREYFGSLPNDATDAEVRACGALLSYGEYARAGEHERLDYLNHLTWYDPREYLVLDAVALQSLELFERRAVHGHENGTLAAVVDETASAPGRRTLDDWLRRPLLDREEIARRHDAVGELREAVQMRERVYDLLRDVYDIERLVSRIARGRANARDLRSLKATLDIVPELRDILADADCGKLASLRESLDPLADVRSLIGEAIPEDPAREITEGGVIKPEYDETLADLRETERVGKDWIDDLEDGERERTGIDSLKVGHNSVHGYYIEVTDANLDRVPEEYERRQTLKNAERYYTPALKEREDEILRAESLADEREYDLFCDIRQRVADHSERVQALADTLAELDVLVSFATVAAEYDYIRPVVGRAASENDTAGAKEAEPVVDGIHIEDGRHPVVERTEESFVPNGTKLDRIERVAVITGPNMSGKSTYMRQVALIVILAQAGSFVPASEARIQVVDRIFTRVGASDDIAGGRSTFMVEMTELADILDNATEHSLVLLDEVGRGTSTADGFAIARAVTEYVHDELGALTLFATHHHDLTSVAAQLDSAYNLHFKTSQDGTDVVFEHAVDRGTADASYGVEVAATAGIDTTVVDRARELLAGEARGAMDNASSNVDAHDRVATNGASDHASRPASGDPETNGSEQSVSDEFPEAAIRETLDSVDIATMTPLEALNTLSTIQQQLDETDSE